MQLHYDGKKMTFSKLDKIEKKVLSIVDRLNTDNQLITIKDLFKLAKKELNFKDQEIDRAIWRLISKKYIADGTKLSKNTVLENENRQKLLKIVFDNPGIHNRQIRSEMEMGSYLTSWHLNMLKKFGFIWRKNVKNMHTYYPYLIDPQDEVLFRVLKDEKSFEINELIFNEEKITLQEICEKLDLDKNIVIDYVDHLKDAGLIDLKQVDGNKFYLGNFNRLKPFIEYWQEKDAEYENLLHLIYPEEPKEEVSEGQVEVKREYDYIGGNVRYKIAVQNNSQNSISNIRVMLTPVDQFTFKTDLKTIDALGPGESRGVDFILTPMTCGRSNVYGTVSYLNEKMAPSSITISPKMIWVKCPLVSSIKADMKELLEWQSELRSGTTSIPYKDISKKMAFDIVSNQISALDLAVVKTDLNFLKAIYSGVAKVTNSKIIVELETFDEIIKLSVWASDLKEVTGFMAYIKNMVNIALDMSSSIKLKEEKIEKQILNAFEFAERLNQLFDYCDTNWNLSDTIILLKEIVKRMERDFPSLPKKINHWIEDLQDYLTNDATLTDQSSIYIEYDVYDILQRVFDSIGSNLEMYKSAFHDDISTIQMIENKYQKLQNLIIDIEKKYSRRILVFLLIIESSSGLSLVQHNFAEKKLDPDLISGFLTAIQSFGMELTTAPTEMKKLAYKNFEIELNVGDYIRGALFLSGPCSNYLVKKLVDFINKFENTYEKPLKNWTGDISKLQGASELVKEFFE